MKVQELLSQARDVLTVKRVFGEPYQRDGVTIIPVASVSGGGGGGGGRNVEGAEEGGGGGFGVSARPAGVYVVRGDEVTWQPAVDANRAILLGAVTVTAALQALRSMSKARVKAARARRRAERRQPRPAEPLGPRPPRMWARRAAPAPRWAWFKETRLVRARGPRVRGLRRRGRARLAGAR